MSARFPIAVVTVAGGRRGHLERQRRSLRIHAPGIRHVVVDLGGDPIDDPDVVVVERPVDEGTPLPIAEARNRGADAAAAEVLVFLDVDCIAGWDLVTSYDHRVRTDGGIWSGPVGYLPPTDGVDACDDETLRQVATFHEGRPRPGQRPGPAPSWQMFWSLSFAVDTTTWHRIGGFDEDYTGYGGEDTDFARTAHEIGVPFWYDGDAIAFHQHHAVSSPPVEHVDDIVANARRYRDKWGSWPMEGWLEEFAARGLIEWRPTGGLIRRLR